MTTQITDFPSHYHKWFKDLGYPDLDVVEYSDGEWAIIQYHNAPVIPSLTKWQTVLSPIRHTIPTLGFIEKFAKQCDMSRREFWAREEEKSRQVEDEHARGESHSEDLVNRAQKAFTKNPNIMNRIAANGLGEMNLDKIRRYVPKSEWHKPTIKPISKEPPDVIRPASQPVLQTIHEEVSAKVCG